MAPQTPPDHSLPEQARAHEAAAGQTQTPSIERQTPAPQSQRPAMSRRSVLRGAAGVGTVAAAAAAVGAGAVVVFDKRSEQPATLMPASKPLAMAPMAPSAMAGPLVVYLADTTSGQFDVFGATGQTRVHNPDLVNQLLANLKLA